eukprot:14778407-Alexandrium_andersonii.AAC.1
MSASLVGSEMCIRDSPLVVHERSGGPVGHVDCWRVCDWQRSRRSHRQDCLLYTSDAADDM